MDLRIAAVMKQLLPEDFPQAENKTQTTVLPADVNAHLDFEKGLDRYQRDSRHKQLIIEHFELNLRQMILLARAARVPMVLVNPVSNLKNCPPFKSDFENICLTKRKPDSSRSGSRQATVTGARRTAKFNYGRQQPALINGTPACSITLVKPAHI